MDKIFRPGLTAAVKEVSKEFSHLSCYEQKVQKHVETLEKFFDAVYKQNNE